VRCHNVQDIDTGSLCMQAFADRAAVAETLETGLATFYSRSRHERWCKGETSGNFIQVRSMISKTGILVAWLLLSGCVAYWYTLLVRTPVLPQTRLLCRS
jgi:Phosphoribosyl-AMP cyclohydrolase